MTGYERDLLIALQRIAEHLARIADALTSHEPIQVQVVNGDYPIAVKDVSS